MSNPKRVYIQKGRTKTYTDESSFPFMKKMGWEKVQGGSTPQAVQSQSAKPAAGQ